MSKQFDRAIKFATDAHSEQKRKMSNLPYILHPFEVSSIAASISDDEDILIAALLHDTIEDAGVSKEEISALFGERVLKLVLSETEDKHVGTPKSETWLIRKQESIDELKKSDDIAIKILWLSDKLSNIRSLYKTWLEIGDDAFNAFHQKDKSAHKWYYYEIANCTSELSNTPAYAEYTELLNKIFK